MDIAVGWGAILAPDSNVVSDCVQREREQEVARLKEERHQARELKRKEEYVKRCRLEIEEKRLKVCLFPIASAFNNSQGQQI